MLLSGYLQTDHVKKDSVFDYDNKAPFVMFMCRFGLFTAALTELLCQKDLEPSLRTKADKVRHVLKETNQSGSTPFCLRTAQIDTLSALFKDIIIEVPEGEMEARAQTRIQTDVELAYADFQKSLSGEVMPTRFPSQLTKRPRWNPKDAKSLLEYLHTAIDAAADPSLHYARDDPISEGRRQKSEKFGIMCMQPSSIRSQLLRMYDAVQDLTIELRDLKFESNLLRKDTNTRPGDRVFWELKIPLKFEEKDLCEKLFYPKTGEDVGRSTISFWSNVVKEVCMHVRTRKCTHKCINRVPVRSCFGSNTCSPQKRISTR